MQPLENSSLVAIAFCCLVAATTIHSSQAFFLEPSSSLLRFRNPGSSSLTSPYLFEKDSSRRVVFSSRNRNDVVRKTTKLNQSSSYYSQMQALKRRGIRMPLLDTTVNVDLSNQLNKEMIIPLPSNHLPDELSTLHMYGMQMKAAIHKMMIDKAVANSSTMGDVEVEPLYGHVVTRAEGSDSLVGAIGCAARVLMAAPSEIISPPPTSDDDTIEYNDFASESSDSIYEEIEEDPITVLAQGSFRFVVKEVIQTFPFPIAIVDELLDEPVDLSSSSSTTEEDKDLVENDEEDDDDDDDDEYDDFDMYSDLKPSELLPRLIGAMKAIVDQKLDVKPQTTSPLEQSILENSGLPVDAPMGMASMQQNQAEEMAAIFDIFVPSLMDIAPSQVEQYYTVAIMAAEMGSLENEARREMLKTVDGIERMKIVLKEVEKKISLVQAKKLTEQIVEDNDEGAKDLQVGDPTLPPWARSITKGMKIQYYWNEEYEWCSGEIVEDPVMIVNELILTIKFEDGETHRLPFQPDEKARWRPGDMK